jgi:spore coat protein CotH
MPRFGFRLALAVLGCCAFAPALAHAQMQEDFFDDTQLQEVRLVVNTRDWATLKELADENAYYPATMTWKNVTVRNIGIRSRGSGTRNGIKPGLRVDFNRYLTNQTFLGMKAVILDNAYSDPSTIRESVSMKLFAKMGLPAPREAHTRLYVNNEYVGIYVIVESIDRTFITRLYGATEGNTELGGYLYEYKWLFDYYFDYLGPDLESYAGLFKPQTRDSESMTNLYFPIEETLRAISETPDQDFATAVGKYLDLQETMKYVGVETFTVEWDGLAGNWTTNNFYLYRFRGNNLAEFVPWDKDHAFTFIEVPIMNRLDQNTLIRRSLATPALHQVFFDTLLQLADYAQTPDPNDPRGWLEREFERQANQVKQAVAEDPFFPFTMDEHQSDVDYLMQFARSRPDYVRCEIARTQDPSIETACTAIDPALNPAPTGVQTAGTASRQVSKNTTRRENNSYY